MSLRARVMRGSSGGGLLRVCVCVCVCVVYVCVRQFTFPRLTCSNGRKTRIPVRNVHQIVSLVRNDMLL